jgi:hypothetical protein
MSSVIFNPNMAIRSGTNGDSDGDSGSDVATVRIKSNSSFYDKSSLNKLFNELTHPSTVSGFS